MIARVIALFAGLFTLVNLLGNLMWPGFDASIWWISFEKLPVWFSQSALAVFAVTMLAFALWPRPGPGRSLFTAAVALIFAGAAFVNAFGFYRLAAADRISAGFPIPFSLVVFAGMLFLARAAWRADYKPGNIGFAPVAAGAALLALLFPLCLMLFFGNTDYRCPADAVVVFGARAYAKGRLSDALEDRIRTACDLYHSGMAKRLILSGGKGDGDVTEASAMRRYALRHGVAANDIFIDDNGLNTEATVRDTLPLLHRLGAHRVLAVSHFYHLPRVKLAYERAGIDVYTVPAHQAHILVKLPLNMAREAAAFWAYYFKQRPQKGLDQYDLNLVSG
jgi:vancomycin permeability regulator SanA